MIYGERIRLRAPERDDIPLFTTWLNDPEIREFISNHAPISSSDEENWFDHMLETPVDEHPLTIEIKKNQDWIPIGNIGLFGINQRNRYAEVGLFIGEKSYWNQGYGSEALLLMLKHSFETLNLNRIFLRVFEYNHRGIKAYEKVGFSHEGKLRQAEFRKGRYWDVLIMSFLRTEWQGIEFGLESR